MKIINCQREEMWADMLTEPLQGKVLRVIEAKLMNCDKNCNNIKPISKDPHRQESSD
jgi:hypothetical protein